MVGQYSRGMRSDWPRARATASSVTPANVTATARKVHTEISRTAKANSGQLVPHTSVSTTSKAMARRGISRSVIARGYPQSAYGPGGPRWVIAG